MAIAEMELKVSLEEALHKSMSDFATNYYKEYGVMIQDISFSWHMVVGGNRLFQVVVETSSNG